LWPLLSCLSVAIDEKFNEEGAPVEGRNMMMQEPVSKGDRQESPGATTRVLDFLSHASNETIASCFVGLGAVTYLVLGRVGLFLIGGVAGIVLHATWERQNAGGDDAQALRRKEAGIEVANRLLAWQDKKQKGAGDGGGADDNADIASQMAAQKRLDFVGFPVRTAEALTTLVNAVIYNYVEWVVRQWNSPTNADQSPPDGGTSLYFQQKLSSHIPRVRP